jgi:hypothetical protein
MSPSEFIFQELKPFHMASKLAEIINGISNNFSFKEAFNDALSKANRNLLSDYFKYAVLETGYIEAGFAQVKQLYVTFTKNRTFLTDI